MKRHNVKSNHEYLGLLELEQGKSRRRRSPHFEISRRAKITALAATALSCVALVAYDTGKTVEQTDDPNAVWGDPISWFSAKAADLLHDSGIADTPKK